eukprot:gene6694-7785_t
MEPIITTTNSNFSATQDNPFSVTQVINANKKVKPISKQVQDFIELRNRCLPSKPSEATTTTATTPPVLSVEALNGLSSLDPRSLSDLAQIKSEGLFNDFIVYFMPDNLRTTILGAVKPELNAQLEAMVADLPTQQWYASLAIPWLALGLNGKPGFTVNTDMLQNDLTILLQKLYQAFLEGDFLTSWPIVVQASQPAYIQSMLKQITNKLDILDPTGATTRDVSLKLAFAVALKQSYNNVDVITKQDIFRSTLLQAIEDVMRSSSSQETIVALQGLVTTAESAGVLAGQLAVAYQSLTSATVNSATTTAAIGEAVVLTSCSEKVQAFFSSLATNVKNNLLGSLFTTVSSMSFIYGVMTWSISDRATKIRTVVNGAGLLISIANTPATVKLFSWVASEAASLFGYLVSYTVEIYLGSVPIKFVTAVFEAIFTAEKVVGFISTVVTPLFMVASLGLMVYDLVQDVDSKNWGAFSLDLIATLCTVGYMVVSTLALTSWSGLLSIVFAVVVGVSTLVKLIFFPPASPIATFYSTLPQRYTDLTLEPFVPTDITCRTTIQQAGTTNYVVPSSTSPSNFSSVAIASNNPLNDPFRVMFVGTTAGDSSLVTIQNPMNSLTTVNSSFFSCRSASNLTAYPTASGPAIETESWVLIDAGNSTFYIYGWNSKYIYIQPDGNLKLSTFKKTAFTFTIQSDWYEPKNYCSVMFGNDLAFGNYVSTTHYGLGVGTTGAYVFTMPADTSVLTNLDTFFTNNPSNLVYSIFQLPSGVTLTSNAYIKVRKTGIPVIKDGQVKGIVARAKLIASGKQNGEVFGQYKALVIPDTAADGFLLK